MERLLHGLVGGGGFDLVGRTRVFGHGLHLFARVYQLDIRYPLGIGYSKLSLLDYVTTVWRMDVWYTLMGDTTSLHDIWENT